MLHTVLMPPPPAPLEGDPWFRVVSLTREPPGPLVVRFVPPTAVTNGWEAGSSTQMFVPSSNAPSSPAAAKIDCPCAAICWKMADSLWSWLGGLKVSAKPHEVL